MMMRIGDASYTRYLVHWFVLSIMGKLISVVPHSICARDCGSATPAPN